MRVLKLAAIAILNVTPLTSAFEVDRKRSNVQYKSNEEEESAAYIGVAPEDERKLQDDMSMSMAENDSGDMCSFCPDGLDDPAFVLPTDDAATCQEASNFANTLLPNDPSCDTVQLAEAFCCTPEPETPDLGTIVDIAAGDDRFTTLVAAVTAAGLVDTLSGDGPFTVFAPTDDAFRALPADTLDALLQDVDQLTSILTYHVVSGKVASTDLVDGPVPTVNGADVTVDLTDGVKINDANVIIPDIEASNGIIHVIDKVLLPPMDLSMPDDGATTEEPPAGETTPVDPPAPAPVDETTDEAPAVPPPAPAPVPVGDSAMFSKSSKSKAAKAKSAKAKTVKEKQAKTTKALEPMDAKAEKVSKSTKSKAAKAKTAKSSTKAVKATTLPAATPADPAPIAETTDEEPVPPETAVPAPDAESDATVVSAPEPEPTRRKLRNTNQK